MSFTIRVISSLRHKPRAGSVGEGPRRDPFDPPEPALTVGRVGDDHLLVLNKFPVFERHLLLVTRAFEAQADPLTPRDLEAAALVLDEGPGLIFYNGGLVAGASQLHKHLQALSAQTHPELLGWLAALAPIDAGPQLVRGWAFDHRIMQLSWLGPGPTRGRALHKILGTLLEAAGVEGRGVNAPGYNLILTRGHMLVVPRRLEAVAGVSINALGFVGSLLVRDEAQRRALLDIGPLQALVHAAGAAVG